MVESLEKSIIQRKTYLNYQKDCSAKHASILATC